MHGFEHTVLWKRFEARATSDQETLVRSLLAHAEALLDRVIETFPTYTLHNHVHAENVVVRMGDLLGDDERLSALEAAMLLLSAYFHDIGMVFDADARANLRDEDGFSTFLHAHPDAYIAVTESDEALPVEIAEWYCRWRHADRVWVYLEPLADELDWGAVPLRRRARRTLPQSQRRHRDPPRHRSSCRTSVARLRPPLLRAPAPPG